MHQPPTGSGTVPLQEYRRDIPPGWMPGNPQYPLREYLEKLRLWYHCRCGGRDDWTPDCRETLRKGLEAGHGVRVPRPDGAMEVGDAALVRLAVDEVHDPATGQVLQHHIPSGVQYLINALRQAFGQQDQDLATQALDKFFGLSRGKMSLAEYSVEFEARFDEAHDRAGLVMNDVAKFYLFFKNSGLSNKTVDYIKLQVQGDYSRFQDARQLALRLSPNRSEHDGGDVFYGEAHEQDYEKEMQSYWYDGWYDHGEDWDWSYYADDGNEGDWYYEPEEIYYDESGEWCYDDEWWPDDGAQHGVQQPSQQDEATTNPDSASSEQPAEEYYILRWQRKREAQRWMFPMWQQVAYGEGLPYEWTSQRTWQRQVRMKRKKQRQEGQIWMEMATLQRQRQGLWLQAERQVEGQGLQPTFLVHVLNNFQSNIETALGCQRRDPRYIQAELFTDTGVLRWNPSCCGGLHEHSSSCPTCHFQH